MTATAWVPIRALVAEQVAEALERLATGLRAGMR